MVSNYSGVSSSGAAIGNALLRQPARSRILTYAPSTLRFVSAVFLALHHFSPRSVSEMLTAE